MKEIFGCREGVLVGHYRSILEQAGIACFVRNEHAAALSELQGPAFYPILCVEEADYEMAMEVLRPYCVPADAWTAHDEQEFRCVTCGEMNPGSFDFCWNCQRERWCAIGGPQS
jgi:hypothetical protein